MSLEKDLRQSLARKAPPPGFADGVMTKIAQGEGRGKARGRLTRALSRVAAVLLVGTIGAGAWMQHQESLKERAEAERASILVKLALRIATEKTNIARSHLSESDATATNGKEGTSHETTTD